MTITLKLMGEAGKTLLPLFDNAGIHFSQSRPNVADDGPVAMLQEVIALGTMVSSLGLAKVIVAWLNAKQSRKVHIVIRPGKVEYLAQGVSPDEAARHIENAADITIIDPPGR